LYVQLYPPNVSAHIRATLTYNVEVIGKRVLNSERKSKAYPNWFGKCHSL